MKAPTLLILSALAAAQASAAVVFSQGDFASAPGVSEVFTEGVSSLNAISGWGIDGTPPNPAVGGNPGSFLDAGTWNSALWVAVAAPVSGDDYTFSIDYITTGGLWANRFSVYGVTAGGVLGGLGSDNPMGNVSTTGVTQLLSSTVNVTENVWVNTTQTITVPAGYAALVFSLSTDGGGTRGYDNILVENAIPEPSTYAALAGALALGLVAYRRRR